MSTEPFIGEVKILGFAWAPRGYALCAGQLQSIASNSAMFALLGTTFGGDGQTTFGLPDLRGRAAIGQGQGIGLPDYTIGEMAGNSSITLLSGNMPAHIHTLNAAKVKMQASTSSADEAGADGLFPGLASSPVYTATPTTNTFTGGAVVSGSTDVTGNGLPFGIMNPYLVMNYSIATEGIFPNRN